MQKGKQKGSTFGRNTNMVTNINANMRFDIVTSWKSGATN
jgi:hypothetical protein